MSISFLGKILFDKIGNLLYCKNIMKNTDNISPIEIKKKVKAILDERNISYKEASKIVDQNETYIQQYITRDSPLRLKETARKRLAQYLQIPEQDLTDLDLGLGKELPVTTIHKIGFVQAGMWQEACQLPEDEWDDVFYVMDENLRGKCVYALGVRGNSMNKRFPPETTTLVCCAIEDYPYDIQNGDYIIAQRISPDGLYECTVKKFTVLEKETIILEAESTDPRYINIIMNGDGEYSIKAVVIDYQTKLKRI